MEFIIIFLANRYFHVVMLITKAVFVDKSTVETSSSIILSFQLPKNFITYLQMRHCSLTRMQFEDVSLAIFCFKLGHFFGS